jgi:hypothetical protein
MADNKYIDCEALALKVKKYLMPNVDIDGTVTVENAERYFLKLLEDAPAVDAVEVVRCEDCIYSRPKHCTSYVIHCRHPQVLRDKYIKFFCGHGKRRE